MTIDPDVDVPARTRTFASLDNLQYRQLFVSGGIAFLAVQALVVARGWLANDITGSNTGLGLMYLAFGVSMLLATPLAGVMADRFSKRNLVALTNATIGATSLWLGVAVALDAATYWMLLFTAAVQGASFAVMVPSRMAMTADVVSVPPTFEVADLMGLMTERRIRHVPVIDDQGALVGLVSIGDVVKVRMDELETERAALVDYITHGG